MYVQKHGRGPGVAENDRRVRVEKKKANPGIYERTDKALPTQTDGNDERFCVLSHWLSIGSSFACFDSYFVWLLSTPCFLLFTFYLHGLSFVAADVLATCGCVGAIVDSHILPLRDNVSVLCCWSFLKISVWLAVVAFVGHSLPSIYTFLLMDVYLLFASFLPIGKMFGQ